MSSLLWFLRFSLSLSLNPCSVLQRQNSSDYVIFWHLFLDLENMFKVLVADINIGYEDIVNTQVRVGTNEKILQF